MHGFERERERESLSSQVPAGGVEEKKISLIQLSAEMRPPYTPTAAAQKAHPQSGRSFSEIRFSE